MILDVIPCARHKMNLLIFLSIFTLVATTPYRLPYRRSPIGCGTSRDCNQRHCCRDSNNYYRLLDPRENPRFILVDSSNSGVCSPLKGQLGESCDFGCPCGEGLLCYRPLTGVCCAPGSCQAEEYVRRKNEELEKCLKNPNCSLPS